MKNLILFFVLSISPFGFAFEAQQVAKFIRSSRDIILPDLNHGSHYFMKEQIKSLRKIKQIDPSYDCLFLEVEPEAGQAIQNFLDGAAYKQSVGQWIKDTSKKVHFPFINVIPDWYLLKAHDLGFKILGADVSWSSKLGQKIIPVIRMYHENSDEYYDYEYLLIGERNKVMARNIRKNLANGTCHKAVLVVGSAHLDATHYKTIQQILNDSGVPGIILM